MKAYKVQITEDAKQDITEIIIYIKAKLKEPQIAMQYKKIFKAAIMKLKDSADIYNVIDEKLIGIKDIRKVNVKNFLIFYRINKNEDIVEVFAVFYAKSNWQNNLKLK